LFLALILLVLLLIEHDFLAEILKKFRVLLSLLNFLALLLLTILIDLADYGGEQLFLISLAGIKLHSLCESLASPSLNKSGKERIGNVVFIDLFLERGRGIPRLFVDSRCGLILWAGTIFQPVL
jgi:hypothetical protein